MAESAIFTRLLNPWVLHLQKMGLELKCPLCLDLFNRPLLLPCNHIFCSSCVQTPSDFKLDCPVCKSPYAEQDLRTAPPHFENMVNIYKSMDAAFGATLFPSVSQADLTDSERPMSQSPVSENTVNGDKLQNFRTETGKNMETPSSSPYQQSEIENQNRSVEPSQVTQPSSDSPPSFGETKDSDDDCFANGRQNSVKRLPMEGDVKKELEDGTCRNLYDGPVPKVQENRVREAKRKFDYGPNSVVTNGANAQKAYSASGSMFMSKPHSPLFGAQQAKASVNVDTHPAPICCPSSKLSEMANIRNDSRIPGGPTTEHIRNLRRNHRSTSIFEGKIDYEFNARNHGDFMRRWKLSDAQVELIRQAGFGPYCEIEFGRHDRALCAALGERWWPTTCSFHFQFGEMSITLEDVYRILGLSIIGDPVTDQHESNYTASVERLLGVQSPGGDSRLNLKWLYETFSKLPIDPTIDQITFHTRAYLLALCGSTLFPDGTGNKVHARYLRFFEDFSRTSQYAWGAAVLSHVYSNLNRFAMGKNNGIYGCITLIQVWAHEHLPVGRPLSYGDYLFPRAKAWTTTSREYQSDAHHSLTYYRIELDNLIAENVHFAHSIFPGEDVDTFTAVRRASCHRSCVIHLQLIYFHPGDRVMRQLGMVQTIPRPPTVWESRGIRSTTLPYQAMIAWQNRMQDVEYVVHGERITTDTQFPWVTMDYRDWFGSPRIHNPFGTF